MLAAGVPERFEYTYELSWKTLQDFLRYKGYIDFAGPNATLSLALQDGYITDADGWRKMKKSRELMPYIYDKEQVDLIDIAGIFADLLKQLCIRLEKELALQEHIDRAGKLFYPL